MKHVLLIICFSASFFLYGAASLSSDGLTLLSLMRHWTFVPPSINSSWVASDSDSTPCSWIGVQCDHAHNVVSLNLTACGISGQLGPEIGELNHLQTVVLSASGFSGKIPSELSDCSLLEYLDLSQNSFSQQIPYSLKELQNLRYINFASNQLTGEIPESLFQIPGLKELYLYNNSLSGRIPTNIGNMTELLSLFLYGNQLNGIIPSSIGSCKSLKKLHLYSNQLEGEIPNELGMLSELEDLELSFNHLTGEIPVSIWKIQTLKHILVHNNSLSGELPFEMTELEHLRNISLFDNQFFGVIPQSLGIKSTLEKLDLMNNKFVGTMPPNLCFGKRLQELNLGLNQLHGGLSLDLGRCATLRKLILKDNNFTGPLPYFESNANLIYMDVSKNNLKGAIPSSLGNCRNLTQIDLSLNKFTGLIPSELGNLENLWFLNLAHNNLEGPLPPQLSNCKKMDNFDVGFNVLNGSLPTSLKRWTGLTTLILRENHFSGGIPAFLSEFDNLIELQLGGNLFGGEIPRSIGALQNLFYQLNLSANGLTGDFPLEIGKLKRLQSLDVSLNNLTGNTEVLVQLPSLTELNISYNSFVGPVPKMLMKFLNSSPSSFLGNPSLCVACSSSNDLNCTKTRYLKSCDNKAIHHNGISGVKIVMIEIGSSSLVFVVLLGLLYIYFHRRAKQDLDADEKGQSILERRNLGSVGATYKQEVSSLLSDVMKATENLNDRYIIGGGAHGIVYKARLDRLPNYMFAVKRIVYTKNKRRKQSMYREIEIIGKTNHRNVIRCEGFWTGKDHGLIFYPYMQNGSLHDILHERNPLPSLAWNVRFRILLGIAEGLSYLHHDCDLSIVHRDIKPGNILLDSDMEPYITDFGISMLLNQSSTQKHLRSTYIVGTVGYAAPEIAYTTVQSVECDVYSYGVVLLELITRKKVLDESFGEKTTLVAWVRSVWEETGAIDGIVDPTIQREFNDSNVKKQVSLVFLMALGCTEKDPRQRPTMRNVIKSLNVALTSNVSNLQKGPDVRKWILRPRDCFKLNIDCLTIDDGGIISLGGVIRDNSGSWVVGYAKKGKFGNFVLAELWAVFLGLEIAIAHDRDFDSLIIESESLVVYDIFCSSNTAERFRYHSLTEACRLLMASIPICGIDIITGESNFPAKCLAKLGMQLGEEVSIFDSSPPCVKPPFSEDSGCII